MGWIALLIAIAGLVLFAVVGRIDVLVAGLGAAIVATLTSVLLPEPTLKKPVRFAPLEGMRSKQLTPSLIRQ
ncbi:MAG: hypothetical protein V3R84_08690, partial [Acidimicrobiia bacterium]